MLKDLSEQENMLLHDRNNLFRRGLLTKTMTKRQQKATTTNNKQNKNKTKQRTTKQLKTKYNTCKCLLLVLPLLRFLRIGLEAYQQNSLIGGSTESSLD